MISARGLEFWGVDKGMNDDGRDYHDPAEYCPIRGPFADEQENPHGIQERFDEAYYARIKRACAAVNALYEKHIGDADLDDSQES